MNDYRIEIGFDWEGSFLPSGAARLRWGQAPKVASQHQFEVSKKRSKPSTVRFYIYDITERVDEALPAPKPRQGRRYGIIPKSLAVVFQAARNQELISPFGGRGEIPNPLTLTSFSSLSGTRYSKSCIFGNLRTRKGELPGWVGERDGSQQFFLTNPGVFLVSYMLVVGPAIEAGFNDRCFTTDPEWVVGGGENPPDGYGDPPRTAG